MQTPPSSAPSERWNVSLRVTWNLPMTRSALVRQPAAVVLAQAAGDRLRDPRPGARDHQRRGDDHPPAAAGDAVAIGRGVTEVLRLRPCDLDPGGPILHLVNLKQRPRRGGNLPRKAVIVSPDLVAALRALTNDAHVAHTGTSSARARVRADRCPTATADGSSDDTRSWPGSASWAATAACGRARAGTSATGRPSIRSGKASR